MDANDTAHLFAQSSGGTKVIDITTYTFFTGHLIC